MERATQLLFYGGGSKIRGPRFGRGVQVEGPPATLGRRQQTADISPGVLARINSVGGCAALCAARNCTTYQMTACLLVEKSLNVASKADLNRMADHLNAHE